MGKILPILMAVIGLAGGVGAGIKFKPPSEEDLQNNDTEHSLDKEGSNNVTSKSPPAESPDLDNAEYVRLNNQFIVPVVIKGRVNSLVVMSISLQVETGARETVFAREPKLRDAFLQVLFDHANAGGFDGMFTTSDNLRSLRTALLESARKNLGEVIHDVLIIDLVRQDT